MVMQERRESVDQMVTKEDLVRTVLMGSKGHKEPRDRKEKLEPRYGINNEIFEGIFP